MKIYTGFEIIKLACPTCSAQPGVWCGISNFGGTAHESRIKAYNKSVYVPTHSSGQEAVVELMFGRHEKGRK